MFTFLGVLLIITAIVSYFWQKASKQREAQIELAKAHNEKQDSRHAMVTVPSPLPYLMPVKPSILLVAAIILLALNGMFFWANAGTAYAVQYPWGGDKMIKTQGLKAKLYGRVIPLSYEISIKDIIQKPDKDGYVEPLPENHDGIYNRIASKWEFSDAIKADIATAVVVGVSVDDEELFLNMADRNRSEGKLISGRVLPNIDAALKNTCKLMDAQEYISGKASDFDRYFRDQLENGMYLVEPYTEEEIDEPEIIGDTNVVRKIKANSKSTKSNKQTKYRIKRDASGNIMRDNKSNTLKQYGIKIYQAQVTGIDWEPSFDKRLDLQKDQVAQTQLEKQEAEKEFYRAKKEIAKGESEKAAERARLEKEQIKLTIAAETKAKVAEQDLIAEKKRYEVEQYKAKSKKVAADAIYYENSKRVQAGLTPQERAKLEKEIAIGVATQLKDLKLPQTYIAGQGNGKSSGLLENLIGADLAKKMMNSK